MSQKPPLNRVRMLVCASVLTAAIPQTLAAQATRTAWARQYGSEAVEQANAVGHGEFGVYQAGMTVGAFAGQTSAGSKDAFISLHDESGTLKWIRQFGTPADDVASGVAGDGSGAYVVGYTRGPLGSQVGDGDAFIRKYDPNGNVLWTRQFGSSVDDYANAVAAHTSGVYVVGQVDCCGANLPGLPPTEAADAFIQKFDGNGNPLWTRMISSRDAEKALGVAVDDSGVYVAGTTNGDLVGPPGDADAFIRKYGHDGAVLWTRQFGTIRSDGRPATDDVFAIAVGPSGVYVAGATADGAGPGATFVGGLWDAFVVKYDANGGSRWYRQIGTTGDDFAYGIAVGDGSILVVGGVSADLVPGAFVAGEDAFLRFYDSDGNAFGDRQFGNGLNDSGRGVVATPVGFFVGGTKNGDALKLVAFGDDDSFVMRIAPPPHVTPGGVLNNASYAASPAPLAPGSLAVVRGNYLNDGPPVLATSLGPDGKVVSSLGGTQVTVNGTPAPIMYSTMTEVAIQIPFERAGESTATVIVTVGGQTSTPRSIDIAAAAPGIFTRNNAGTGEAIAVHNDGVTLVTPAGPARRNEVVILYVTGLGVLTPAVGTGVPTGANIATVPVAVMFGSANAAIEYAGAAPGFVGLNQINARIPAGAPTGNDVPISITAGGLSANPATIAIAP